MVVINQLDAPGDYATKLHRLNLLGGLILILLAVRQGMDALRVSHRGVEAKVVFRLRHRLFERLLNLASASSRK